jgi:hypothetical protein
MEEDSLQLSDDDDLSELSSDPISSELWFIYIIIINTVRLSVMNITI